MKTTKTLFITLICSFIFSLTTPSSIAFANHTLITSNVYAASTDATPPEISPASHTIVWKYKTLNGVLYKCRYNQQQGNGLANGLKLNFSNIRKRHVNNHQMMREIMENCILKIILLSLTSQLPCSHFK